MCISSGCALYLPDYERAKREGQLCFGMGYEPPCANCGQGARYHKDSKDSILEMLEESND